MTKLHPALEALMPEPVSWQIALIQDNEWGQNIVGWRDEFSRASFSYSMLPKREMFTATQMREAILAATERAAKVAEEHGKSVLDGQVEWVAEGFAAAIRGDRGGV